MKKLLFQLQLALLLNFCPHLNYAQSDNLGLVLQKLIDGNTRFRTGNSMHPRQDVATLKSMSQGQKPFAVIMGCSDSRVPNEIIFDQGLGDLFIVRTAGQVPAAASFGSIEFAERILGAKLIVVLGHTSCGAVSAAVNVSEVPGHIVHLINEIKPAVIKAKEKQGDLLTNSIYENVLEQVKTLKGLEPVLAKDYEKRSIWIVGAVYHLEDGRVEFLEETFN